MLMKNIQKFQRFFDVNRRVVYQGLEARISELLNLIFEVCCFLLVLVTNGEVGEAARDGFVVSTCCTHGTEAPTRTRTGLGVVWLQTGDINGLTTFRQSFRSEPWSFGVDQLGP